MAAGAAWAALGFSGSTAQNSARDKEKQLHLPTNRPNTEEDWAKIRSYFHPKPNQVYMNNGTIGLMSDQVIQTMQEKFLRLQMGYYTLEDSIREKIAMMLNAKTDEIALTHNTTQGINIVAQGIKLRKGDEVILCDQEHVGNALPWLNRAKRSGIKIKVLQVAMTAAENLDRIDRLVTKRTRVIALPHITCTTGLVLPIKEIAAYARKRNIWSFFDGAHGPGMLFPDVADIGCDFYASCGHKWLCGPAGTAFLYLRKGSMDAVTPVMVGANSDSAWELTPENQKITGFVDSAHRFEYGTQSNPIYQGLQAAIELMDAIGFDRVRNRSTELAAYLQQKLLNSSTVKMLSSTEAASRSAMIGFKIAGMNLDDFRNSNLAKEFRLRWVAESSLDSIRISTHIYNTFEEIDELVDLIGKMAR